MFHSDPTAGVYKFVKFTTFAFKCTDRKRAENSVLRTVVKRLPWLVGYNVPEKWVG